MADIVKPFWKQKTLSQMNTGEWESICDGCGKCCLHKLQDDDTEEVFYTNIACRYLNHEDATCGDYANRASLVPECITLTVDELDQFHWLPNSCSYRLLAEARDLPPWHHLISGDRDAVHAAGASVCGRVVAEERVEEDDYEEHIIHWVE